MQLVLNSEQVFHLKGKVEEMWKRIVDDYNFIYYEGGNYSLKQEVAVILRRLESILSVESIVHRVCIEAFHDGTIEKESQSLKFNEVQIVLDARECFFINKLLEK